MCNDSTHNEQVEASVCRINFNAISSNATLFSSRKIILFWKVLGWLRVICTLTQACSFASWKILNIDYLTLPGWNKWQKWQVEPVEAKNLTQTRAVLWLKITPTYCTMKDNDVWQEKYFSITSSWTKENNCLDRSINNDERCRTFYAWISVLTLSITNCYCCLLRGRGNNKVGTLTKI